MNDTLQQTYKVAISVHIGDPVDWQKYRHTGLYFEPLGADEHTYYMHVRGPVGGFIFESWVDYDVQASASLVRLVQVGVTRRAMTPSALEKFLWGTPVQNQDREFNCQVWVSYALARLHQAGYLAEDDCDRAFDEAIEVTMEAKDDPSYR